MWTSRREIVTAVVSLENTAVISINDFWKPMWAKSYLGAIGQNFVWAMAPWLPRPCIAQNRTVHGGGLWQRVNDNDKDNFI